MLLYPIHRIYVRGYMAFALPPVCHSTSHFFVQCFSIVVVVNALLFYVHGKHLRSCRDGQLT